MTGGSLPPNGLCCKFRCTARRGGGVCFLDWTDGPPPPFKALRCRLLSRGRASATSGGRGSQAAPQPCGVSVERDTEARPTVNGALHRQAGTHGGVVFHDAPD